MKAVIYIVYIDLYWSMFSEEIICKVFVLDGRKKTLKAVYSFIIGDVLR